MEQGPQTDRQTAQLEPTDYNPLLDSISTQENQAHLLRVKQQIATALGSMARHEDYIRKASRLT
jgi:hypothetical protein